MLISTTQRPLSDIQFVVYLRVLDATMSIREVQRLWHLLGGEHWTFPTGFFARGRFVGRIPADNFRPTRRVIKIGDQVAIEGVFLTYPDPDQRIVDEVWSMFETSAKLAIDYFMDEAHASHLHEDWLGIKPLEFEARSAETVPLNQLPTHERQHYQLAPSA